MQQGISSATCSTPGVDLNGVRNDETWVDYANLVRAEYSEMPGLSLSAAQVQRLWNLDPKSTSRLLTHLVRTGFLCCTPKGTYRRAR